MFFSCCVCRAYVLVHSLFVLHSFLVEVSSCVGERDTVAIARKTREKQIWNSSLVFRYYYRLCCWKKGGETIWRKVSCYMKNTYMKLNRKTLHTLFLSSVCTRRREMKWQEVFFFFQCVCIFVYMWLYFQSIRSCTFNWIRNAIEVGDSVRWKCKLLFEWNRQI